MSSETWAHLQPGPCVTCGATDYPLSAGGPGVCPACDCVPPSLRGELPPGPYIGIVVPDSRGSE